MTLARYNSGVSNGIICELFPLTYVPECFTVTFAATVISLVVRSNTRTVLIGVSGVNIERKGEGRTE